MTRGKDEGTRPPPTREKDLASVKLPGAPGLGGRERARSAARGAEEREDRDGGGNQARSDR